MDDDNLYLCNLRSGLSFSFSATGKISECVEGCALKHLARRKNYGGYKVCEKCKHRIKINLSNVKIVFGG